MNIFKKLRNDYVNWHADRIKFPTFESGPIVRKSIVFSGRVQNVGFRLEVYRLAQRMELTGWVQNLPDDSVEAELQGEESKIQFLIDCMQSLKRASVNKLKMSDLPINEDEENFTIVG